MNHSVWGTETATNPRKTERFPRPPWTGPRCVTVPNPRKAKFPPKREALSISPSWNKCAYLSKLWLSCHGSLCSCIRSKRSGSTAGLPELRRPRPRKRRGPFKTELNRLSPGSRGFPESMRRSQGSSNAPLAKLTNQSCYCHRSSRGGPPGKCPNWFPSFRLSHQLRQGVGIVHREKRASRHRRTEPPSLRRPLKFR